MNSSPPGSFVHGISQAQILEWVAIFFCQGILLTQGLNLRLLHWQADSLLLSHQGSFIDRYIFPFFIFFSIVVYHRILNIVPWVILL